MQAETKGQATKHHILKEGLILASVKGLVNISIGGLAAKADMSRSGLFAHFLSKEQLQLEILEFAHNLFYESVMVPCEQLATPLEKLQYLAKEMPGWYDSTDPKIPGGCIFLTATAEFDDRPGRIKDLLLKQQTELLNTLKKLHRDAVEAGQFKGAITDDDFAFIFYSYYMGYNQYKKFFGDENAKEFVDRHFNSLFQYAIHVSPEQAQTIYKGK